jgi:hypothetical protein
MAMKVFLGILVTRDHRDGRVRVESEITWHFYTPGEIV